MNTTQLQCFTTLANTLNYVRAAEELHMTQPAVTRQIQSLEQELGAKLFFRTTKNVSLTQIGMQFLPEASSMLNTYYHSVEWISSFHQNAAGKLRIGYADTHALRLISDILHPMLKDRENIAPELILGQTDANLHKLTSGDLDLIFGIRDARFTNDAIRFIRLHEEHFFCVCRKDHPIAAACRKRHKSEVFSTDLSPYPQIIDIPPYLLKNVFSRGHRIIPINDELNNILVTNASEAYALVLAGAGFALLPHYLLMKHPDLKFLDWKESPHTQLGIYCRNDQTYNSRSAVEDFIRNAQALFQA